MRVTIAFPSSLSLPNQIYYSLPILAGALRRAGHEPRCVDLNLAAADRLLDDRMAERYLKMAHDTLSLKAAAGSGDCAAASRRALAELEPNVREGERFKLLLRDKDKFYDQELFLRAFLGIKDALSFYYQLDAVFSPYRKRFGADVIEHVEAEPWSPLSDLYREGLVDEVLANEPELVGVCVAFPEQAADSVCLARALRTRRPDLHICFGGPLLNVKPDAWLADDWLLRYADTIVLGDGAKALAELCDALEGRRDLEQVPNLVYRDGSGKVRRPDGVPLLEEMDELPLADFDACDLNRAFLPRPIYPLATSLGCYWGKCAFCSSGWREHFRQASLDRLRQELLAISRQPEARYVQLQDSCAPPRGAAMLAQVIQEENLDLYWVGGMRLEQDFLDRSFCENLARGGCRSLCLGFESANQQVLDTMDKGFLLEQVPAMLDNLRQSGISADLVWFVGFPTETESHVRKTLEFLYDHRHRYGMSSFVGDYQMHPDTVVFRRPQDFGVKILGMDNGFSRYITEQGIQQDRLLEIKQRLAVIDNRTLMCNGSHLPHLVESGIDISRISRPMLPADALED